MHKSNNSHKKHNAQDDYLLLSENFNNSTIIDGFVTGLTAIIIAMDI